MPIWVIEVFGARDLQAAFLFIALMTSPWWIGMICFPEQRLLRRLAQPWLIVPLYSVVLLVLVWKAYEAAALPQMVTGADYGAARSLARHPIAFLAVFCNLQIINLFMGLMIYQKAARCRFRAPVELTLAWFLGAVALLPFAVRLILRKQAGL